MRLYVDAYVLMHGRPAAIAHLGVSRYTLWRYLERRHDGRAIPQAVIGLFGDDSRHIDEARYAVLGGLAMSLEHKEPESFTTALRETLLMLCAAPFATVGDLASLNRFPETTLRDRLRKLTNRGLVSHISHHYFALGNNPHKRFFPTLEGISAVWDEDGGARQFIRSYPVSRQWFRLFTERLDAIAVIYRVAAMVADEDPRRQPVRIDFYRSGPYDALLTLSHYRSIGIVRQGPTLPSASLRYRLNTIDRMGYEQEPLVTLVLTHSNSATRRAIRALSNYNIRSSTYVATERQVLWSLKNAEVWQEGGYGYGQEPPVAVEPDSRLSHMFERLHDLVLVYRRELLLSRKIEPNPDELYPLRAVASAPDPAKQLAEAHSVQLSATGKEVLDVLAAWPFSTTDQFASFLRGATRRRANQVLRSLRSQGLIRNFEGGNTLTDEGLAYLARRDRAAVGKTLDRWSSESADIIPGHIEGTALRSIDAQIRHHDGIIGFASALNKEVAYDRNYRLFDLLPTSRTSVTFNYRFVNYTIHPDATFLLEYRGKWYPYLLEFERRATTPRRIRDRLTSYRRYFRTSWPRRDHGGKSPRVLFVFESAEDEWTFLHACDEEISPHVFTSNEPLLDRLGVLGLCWRRPPPRARERTLLREL